MPQRILFVCMGNICRSPTAEGVTRALAERAGVAQNFEIDSAGTHGYHIGKAPDARATKAAAERGYDLLPLRGRRVSDEDFVRFDYILAMDRDNFAGIAYLDSQGQYTHKVRLMCDFCTQHSLREVPDPYYGGAEGFNQVLDLLMAACQGLLGFVQQEMATNPGSYTR